MTRVNIEIPENLHKQLKIKALKADITLKNCIINILKEKTVKKSGAGAK